MSDTYDFRAIEPHWQQQWEQQRAFRAANPGEPGSDKPKFYVLDFFPYPSGAGLHVGHPLGYIASDIVARYRRMRGDNVLHPMGWDAFGLPAEQYAVETGVHPAITTQRNIETYKRQLRMIGLGYDWDREVATCKPDYYQWTQWIFLKIYDSWYDPDHVWTDRAGRRVRGAARAIADLPIPPEVAAQGEPAVEQYRDDHRLAYLAEVPVNWCPALGTVLSNEEVTSEGRSDRGNHPVIRRPMKQWMLRITEYAERLLEDLEPLDWPEPIKLMQRNWIGKSHGAYVDFTVDVEIDGQRPALRVFTTRPDTLFGATYMVLAPEHRLVDAITTADQRAEVDKYVTWARNRSDLERTADTKTKTGVPTGAYAINPVNGHRIPIWVADYVLIGYGTGAIMAVPAHDTRDYEFAEAFGLEIVQVVQPPGDEDWRGFVGDGVNVNSPPEAERGGDICDINDLPTPQAKGKITAWLEEQGLGEGTVQYKLRDWLFSRQRYWGEPFPIVYRPDGQPIAVDESELPVTLPEMDDFRPHASDDPNAEPQLPLSKATEWLTVERDGQTYRRETNTMPQWAGSCWYYLRFCDPRNDGAMIDADVEQYWLGGTSGDGTPKVGGVDLYMGGAEHAVLHLLYARFWHKVLYDRGVVSTPEPFHKLFNQGMIQSYAFQRDDGIVVPRDRVLHLRGDSQQSAQAVALSEDEPLNETAWAAWENGGRQLGPRATQALQQRGEVLIDSETGAAVTEIVAKMSKSLKNVVNPDQIIHDFGADTLRLYEMYMGPLEASKPWNTRDIVGVHRFLQRVWRLVVLPVNELEPDGRWHRNPRIGDPGSGDQELERQLHKAIAKVEADIGRFAFNTAIAELIKWVNGATKADRIGRDQVERFLIVLAPFAPHICEELWQRLRNGTAGTGNTTDAADLIVNQPWPGYDETLTQDETVEVVVQVKGKVRGRIQAPAGATQDQVVELACAEKNVERDLAGREIRKVIFVPGRLVNLIV